MQTGVFEADVWFGEESFEFEEATQAGLLESSGQQTSVTGAPQGCEATAIPGQLREAEKLCVVETSAPCIEATELQQAMLDGLAAIPPSIIATAANVPLTQLHSAGAATVQQSAPIQQHAQLLTMLPGSQPIAGNKLVQDMQHADCNQNSSSTGAPCQVRGQQAKAGLKQEQSLAMSNPEDGRLSAVPAPDNIEPLVSSQQQHLPAEQQRKRRKVFVMPDIEDAGLCLDRAQQYRFGRGLSVTDFTASEWCQQQVAFNLSAKLPKEVTETEAMAAGKKQHAELEAETAVEVEVNTESREDVWGLRLLATIESLHQLKCNCLTREVFCFGFLQGCWVRGIVDQIELDADGRAVLVEYKTRFNPSLPSHAQKRTARLQVLLYCALFGSLAASAQQHLPSMLRQLKLDGQARLGKAVVDYAESLGLVPVSTLEHVGTHLASVASQAPLLAPAHYVRYLWQGDRSELGQESVKLDGFAVQQALRRHLLFWSGDKAPEVVPATEDWKCRHCLFAAKCPAGRIVQQRA